jgi:hypothetical protein
MKYKRNHMSHQQPSQHPHSTNDNDDIWPKLKFYGGLDDEKARDISAQGCIEGVLVEFQDGRHYAVNFEDVESIKRIIDRRAREEDVHFYAEPGLVVVDKVTLKNMLSAVRKLVQQGEYGFFTYLREWDATRDAAYHAEYLEGMARLSYEYPTAQE